MDLQAIRLSSVEQVRIFSLCTILLPGECAAACQVVVENIFFKRINP